MENTDREKEIREYAERKASEPIFVKGRTTAENADYQKTMQENAPYMTLGIQMALTISAFAGLGWWLDKENGTSFWIGICSGFGAVAGLGYFLLVVLRMEKKKEEKKKAQKKSE